MQKFYSEDEAERILKAAVRQSSSDVLATDSISRDRLLAMAAEAGISPEMLVQAEQSIARTKNEKDWRIEFRKKQLSELGTHIGIYLTLNLFLIGVWALSGAGYFWPAWSFLGWGIGIAAHLFAALVTGSDSYKRKLSKYIEKKQKVEFDTARAARLLADYFAVAERDDKIGAIKYVRDHLKMSPSEANNAVQRYMSQQTWP